MKIGFIGMGNMGYAMLKGILNVVKSTDVIFSEPNKERAVDITRQTGVESVDSNAECANNVKYIILAVKPQFYPQVLKNIENVLIL